MSTAIPTDWKQYRRLRTVLRQHQNAAIKSISRPILNQCAKQFGILKGNKLMVDSESELTILMDFCIYSHRTKGGMLVEEYLAKLPPTDDADEKLVRAAMLHPQFSMYKVETRIPDSGISVRDLVRGNSLLLVDETLTTPPGAVLGGRLIPLPDYWMTTGACFPMSEDAEANVAEIFLPALRIADDKELATVAIRAAMRDGTTSMIEYI